MRDPRAHLSVSNLDDNPEGLWTVIKDGTTCMATSTLARALKVAEMYKVQTDIVWHGDRGCFVRFVEVAACARGILTGGAK